MEVPLLHCEARVGGERLPAWRENVGAPIAIDLPADSTDGADSTALILLSWNVWIGRGRLTELVRRLQAGAYQEHGADPGLPIVALLQEAYRVDESVPARSNGRAARELITRLRVREEIVDCARELGFALRYVPSMRNSGERSDRGNAILSSLPLSDASAIELPLVLQRRVAVRSSIALAGRRLTLVSVHLDPRGPPGRRWLGAAGRALQTRHLLDRLSEDPVILGADLNLGRGRAERSWRLLADEGFAFGVPPSLPRWRHTYHALPRLVLDYILVRDRGGHVSALQVHRLDEHPHDRGREVFGSDHHPLLARLDLRPAGRTGPEARMRSSP